MSRFACPGCGHVYDESAGNPREGFPPGTPFASIPESWSCPDCGVRERVDFEPIAVVGAGPRGESGDTGEMR